MPETLVHPLRPSEMKLGRSEKSPPPKIKLRDFVDVEAATRVLPIPLEQSVDYANLVRSWPMFLNDKLGDCTCAGAAHAKQTYAAMVGDPFTVEDRDVERMYEASGYDPSQTDANGENPTDQGWTLQAAAEYLTHTGLQGEVDIVGSAEVTLHDDEEEQVALELFGCLYEGFECPESALQQAREGKPWVPVQGSPIAGGHCVIRPKALFRKEGWHVSWGILIPASDEFDKEYMDEYMVLVPKEWEKKIPQHLLDLGIVDFSKLASLVDQFVA